MNVYLKIILLGVSSSLIMGAIIGTAEGLFGLSPEIGRRIGDAGYGLYMAYVGYTFGKRKNCDVAPKTPVTS